LLPWCRSKGYLSLKQLTVDELTQFRATWPDSPISKYKKQERLKSFFHFCVAREWVRTNPVLGIKPVKVPPSPTLPFEEDQMKAIRCVQPSDEVTIDFSNQKVLIQSRQNARQSFSDARCRDVVSQLHRQLRDVLCV
jgi:site-specific recombinase XerD